MAAATEPEPVMPEVPPFTAPRTYAVVDTLEGLDHWIEAAEQAGAVAIWPAASAVAGTPPGALRHRAGDWRRGWPPMFRSAITAPGTLDSRRHGAGLALGCGDRAG